MDYPAPPLEITEMEELRAWCQGFYEYLASGPFFLGGINIGDGTNYAEIKNDGEINLHGTAQTKCIIQYRARFRWKDADEIYIDPGSYFLDGTVRQVQFWDAAITFKFGSAGSNAGSTDLGASEWHYLYIDDSTMADGTSEITAASKFINSTTGPSWSDTKHGWYNGSDLFLIAVKTSAANAVLEFHHDGGNYVELDEKLVSDIYQEDIDDTFTDVTLDTPVFGDDARVRVRFNATCTSTGGGSVCYRKNGSSSSGIEVMYIHCTDIPRVIMPQEVITDSSQKIEVKLGDGDSTISVHTLGWYYPVGA